MMAALRLHAAWIWLVVAMAVVGALSVLASSSPPGQPLGVSNSRPNGALALYLWLGKIGYRVEAAGPNVRVGALRPRRDTLLLLAPQHDPSSAQLRSIRRWVRSGGRLVLGTDGSIWQTFAALGMHIVPAPAANVRVTQPLLLSPPTSRLHGSTGIVGEEPVASREIAATSFGPVLVRRSVGRGAIWLLTAPNLLDNGNIGRAENRRLALNLVGNRGSRLEFSEIGPGVSPGPTDWLTGTAWGLAMLFGLTVALLYRWLGGWRLGPPILPFAERRRPAIEYVYSLADLLRRGRKRHEILAIYQRALRQFLVRRYGSDDPARLPGQVSARVARLLSIPPNLSEEQLVRQLGDILACEEEMRVTNV